MLKIFLLSKCILIVCTQVFCQVPQLDNFNGNFWLFSFLPTIQICTCLLTLHTGSNSTSTSWIYFIYIEFTLFPVTISFLSCLECLYCP